MSLNLLEIICLPSQPHNQKCIAGHTSKVLNQSNYTLILKILNYLLKYQYEYIIFSYGVATNIAIRIIVSTFSSVV